MALPWAVDPFLDVAALLLVAAIAGAIGLALRQPLIVAFLVAGIAAGPSGLDIVRDSQTIHFLGQMGVAMLLFLVGLRLDPRELRHLGPAALAIGAAQVVITVLLAFVLARLVGLGLLPSIYAAVALTFSSTIIIVKLLSDKQELDSLHGRVAVGVLIVQDILVIGAFAALSFMGTGTQVTFLDIAMLVGRGVILIITAWGLVWLARLRLLDRLAHSKEFLGLAAVAWAIVLAATAEASGLSKELGAFVAGVALAPTAYRDAIGSRLMFLRDFLLLFFLIDLGSVLDLAVLGDRFYEALVLSAFVLLGKPLILLAIMGAMGYRKKTAFLTGLTMAQISEFSLILVALGLSVGHVAPTLVGLVTMVGLITIAGSTYLILYAERLYDRLERWLGFFERRQPWRGRDEHAPAAHDIILFGLGRFGAALASALEGRDMRVLVVDVDPQVIYRGRRRGLAVRYGDAEDPEFPGNLPLDTARWIVSTIPDAAINRSLAAALRHHGFSGRIALTAHSREVAALLEEAAPDHILAPFQEAASAAARQIAEEGSYE